jgi:hypothetical protein
MRTALAIFMMLTVIAGVIVVNWDWIIGRCFGKKQTDSDNSRPVIASAPCGCPITRAVGEKPPCNRAKLRSEAPLTCGRQ